jgi:hypothetical protein
MTRQENEGQENRRFLDEFLERYRQLSSWGRFQVDLYLKWMTFQRRLGKIVWDWLIIQWKVDKALLRIKERLGRNGLVLFASGKIRFP